MEIFWIENGKKQGPLPVVEIISKIQREELTENTRGWHSGCSSWVPLKDLPALDNYFTLQTADDIFAEPDETHQTFSGEALTASPDMSIDAAASEDPNKTILVPTPGIRFWARLTDLLIYSVLSYIPVQLWNIPYSQSYIIGTTLGFVVYEILWIRLAATTPGKAIFNIKVQNDIGDNLSWKISILRTLYVFFMGMGCMTVPFLPIMPLFSWWLTHKIGITPWDIRLRVVTHITARLTLPRIVLCALVIIVCLQIIPFLIEPWYDQILTSTEWSDLMKSLTGKTNLSL